MGRKEKRMDYVIADNIITEAQADFALRVVGDSMEPLYYDGDTVYIRAQDDVEDGQIAAVSIDGGGILKRVYHTKDGTLLVTINPKYRPIRYTPNNTDNIRIIGLAVAYFRETIEK